MHETAARHGSGIATANAVPTPINVTHLTWSMLDGITRLEGLHTILEGMRFEVGGAFPEPASQFPPVPYPNPEEGMPLIELTAATVAKLERLEQGLRHTIGKLAQNLGVAKDRL